MRQRRVRAAGRRLLLRRALPQGHRVRGRPVLHSVVTVNGQQTSVCVPRSDVCGSTSSVSDGGMAQGQCGTLVGPAIAGGCPSCVGKSSCQPNGCYGGWWCNGATNRCQPAPSSCGGAISAFDPGAPVTGQVDPNGGRSRASCSPWLATLGRQPRRHRWLPDRDHHEDLR